MKKVKKVMLPLLLSMVLLVGSCMSVSAAGADYDAWYTYYENALAYYESNGITIGNYHLIYADDANAKFYFYSSDSAFTLSSSNTVDYSGSQTVHFTIFYLPDCSRVDFEVDVYSGAWCAGTFSNYQIDDDAVSNFNICSTGSSDIVLPANNDFFLGPLSPLRKIAGTIQPKMVMKEIIGMIPLLIPLLAGFLGLRKALSLISRTLQAA